MIDITALFAILKFAAMAACGVACVLGYRMLDTNEQRGHLLIGAGSAGLVLVAPNLIFQALSLYWVWAAAKAYQRCCKPS